MELNGSVGHGIRQSPFLEFYQVRRRCSGAVNDEPIAHRSEVDPHLGQPFPIVGPIQDQDIGRDGSSCLGGRHCEIIKKSVTGPTTK